MVPVLERVHQALDIRSRLDSTVDEGNYSKVSSLTCSGLCSLLTSELDSEFRSLGADFFGIMRALLCSAPNILLGSPMARRFLSFSREEVR